jgi:hypothetical protein
MADIDVGRRRIITEVRRFLTIFLYATPEETVNHHPNAH